VKLKNFLYLNNKEKRGFFVLVCLIFILQIVRIFLLNNDKNYESKKCNDDKEFISWVNSFDHFDSDTKSNDIKQKLNKIKNNVIEVETIIDINNISDSLIKKLNLPEKLKNAWINYRKHGGYFYRVEDIKKLYGMNDSLFLVLKPYLIVNKDSSKCYAVKNIESNNKSPIDLNTANRYSLLNIVGDNEVVEKIISYRKKLGGYYNIDQLYEIENLNYQIITKIRLNFFIDTLKIKKIDINKASFYILKYHPYIGVYYAKKIINFREFNKNIEFDDLKKYNLLNDTLIKKLKPYVK